MTSTHAERSPKSRRIAVNGEEKPPVPLPEGECNAIADSAPAPWDVARAGQEANAVEKAVMLLPNAMAVVGKVALNVVGGATAGMTYGLGKLGEVAGAGKAVDSAIFQAGFKSWMYTNGIFPSVQYEPISEETSSVLVQMLGNDVKVKEQDMSLTPIIISNHVSYLDGAVLASLFGAPKIVAKAGARSTPVLGHFMEEMDVIFVQKDDKDSRQATLDAIRGHCTAWSPGQRPLLVFPEGTTTNGEVMAPLKKGTFISGAPVRPVIIVYTGQFDPANPTFKETSQGLEKISDVDWCAQFLGTFIHSMHVRVLAPYFPNEREASDPELYAANMQAFMAQELARVREEVSQDSWKLAAGRADGGLGYKFGDVTRMTLKSMDEKLFTQGTCDEGSKSRLNGSNCCGRIRKCRHCGQSVCTFHRSTNTQGMLGGHSGCTGLECKISAVYKHNCNGRVRKCESCGDDFCDHHKRKGNLVTGHFSGHVCIEDPPGVNEAMYRTSRD